MKKPVTIFVLLCLALLASVQAQTVDSVICSTGGCNGQSHCVFQLKDGNIVASSILAEAEQYNITPFGIVLHKFTKDGCLVTDSAILRYNTLPGLYICNAPDGDGYILAELGNADDFSHAYFRMRRFDDNLVFDTLSDIKVTVHDTLIGFFRYGLQLNPNNDMVLMYSTLDSTGWYFDSVFFALYGLDGTLKQRKQYSIEEMPFINLGYGPGLFSQSPLRYHCWGRCHNASPIINVSLQCFVLDSLFEMEKQYTIEEPHPLTLFTNWSERMLGLDGGGFLMACGYGIESTNPAVANWLDNGIMVRKYDMESNLLKEVMFHSTVQLAFGIGQCLPIGLKRGNDGSVFLAYVTPDPHRDNQVSVIKMDEDLNVIWQRYCLGDLQPCFELGEMTVLDDNSVAIAGTLFDHNALIYIVVHDDYDAIEEQGMAVRPYAYWPNPAQDRLHLQYSPDVTPTQIELYDLQGRLVRTQRNGLESLDLQGLSSGTYSMRVTLENGKAFSDKVVKE